MAIDLVQHVPILWTWPAGHEKSEDTAGEGQGRVDSASVTVLAAHSSNSEPIGFCSSEMRVEEKKSSVHEQFLEPGVVERLVLHWEYVILRV